MSGTLAPQQIQPSEILKELSELWTALGQEEAHGVLRACSMTMILVVDDTEDVAVAGETLSELMHDHPSRAIVVRVRLNEPRALLQSRVFAQCWMPFGRRQQICCEQVEITTSPSSLVEVTPVLLGLTVPDLPVLLVCTDAGLSMLPHFSDLVPLATKVVLDSSNAADPAAMARLIQVSGSPSRTVADLAWARLSRWREPIARAFDAPGMVGLLPAVTGVMVTHCSGVAPLAARYLSAWLAHAAPPFAATGLTEGLASPEIQSCRLSGEDLSISLTAVKPDLLELEVNGTLKRIPCPNVSGCEYLRSELGILGRDPAFETAFAGAMRQIQGG